MAKAAHAVGPYALSRVGRSRAANCTLLGRTVHSDYSVRASVAMFASKQDPESLSVSTQPQPVNQDPDDLRTFQRRRWSNLSGELIHEPGTVIGSATLIAGTTIGETLHTCINDRKSTHSLQGAIVLRSMQVPAF